MGKLKYFVENLLKDGIYKGYICEVIDLKNYDLDE